MEFSIRPFVVLYEPAGEAMQVFHRFTSLFSYCSFLLIKVQPTDLAVAGCGVCMMLPGTILPPGMGVPFFIGVILRLSFLKVRFLAKPIDASIMGLLAYEIVPFRAEFFPPDGSLFLQCRQCSGEFVTPL